VLHSYRQRTAANSAVYLLGDLDPRTRILDVGCGIGTITADLAARCREGLTIGIDWDRPFAERSACRNQ
jgi:precorrin-6B methylase 2